MGVFKKYAFAGRKTYKQNTFIGGVASTINTSALLATKLAIDVSRISLFEVRGSDIRCRIVGNYIIPSQTFSGLNINHYIDNGSLATLDQAVFKGALGTKLKVYLPGVTSMVHSSIAQFQDVAASWILDMPNCTNLPAGFQGHWGTTVPRLINVSKCNQIGVNKLNNNVFIGVKSSLKVYAPISEQTSNSGSMDGDLQAVVDAGGTVIFVPNYTKPAEITTLTAGTITATTIQLNFTPPSSTNAIEAYEVEIDGVWYQDITASGESITGLTPNTLYKNITVRARDIYYNRAEQMDDANMVEATTL